MNRRHVYLIIIAIIVAVVVLIDLPQTPSFVNTILGRQLKTTLGLDLTGGVQVLLAPQAGFPFTSANLDDAAKILQNRTNALGVAEITFQIAGGQYVLAEFPDVKNQDAVNAIIQETGLLEFVGSDTPLAPDTVIQSDYTNAATSNSSTVTETPLISNPLQTTPTGPVYHTVITGADLKSVSVTSNPNNPTLGIYIEFTLKSDGATKFADYTSAHVGQYLMIVLDHKVFSSPRIDSAITGGKGIIQGNFTSDTANQLATVLRYGSLPVPLEIVQNRVIGPTLGQDSLNKSIMAGLIGFAIAAIFMIIYYRLPGVLAVLSMLVYASVTYAIFRLLSVTLTLPGITGFLLSTGGALDANILIFERMREELRSGKNLLTSIDLGWKRAWPSIRDSNISTLVTSVILFWFGSASGASIVKGFALTLAIGIVVSLISAIFVTRTFLDITIDFIKPSSHKTWFGA